MSLRFLISASPLQRAALGLTIAISPLCTQAASPLRGNPVDSVPRIESPTNGADSARVDVLIRGSFPDACYELSGVTQSRVARLIDVTLTVRRPQGAFCATVVRPYRFYLELDGRFAPGPYTLTVNGTVAPFEVRF